MALDSENQYITAHIIMIEKKNLRRWYSDVPTTKHSKQAWAFE